MPYRFRWKRLEYLKRYQRVNRKAVLEGKRSYWKSQRLEVLLHYSKGKLQCNCCKEKTYEFMCLDHINGNGAKQRRRLKTNYLLSWLKQHKYPKGFQVLCHNCNMAKGFYGKCPHKKN